MRRFADEKSLQDKLHTDVEEVQNHRREEEKKVLGDVYSVTSSPMKDDIDSEMSKAAAMSGKVNIMESLVIKPLSFAPNPWIVLKTKREDGVKVFLNVLHHPMIPVLDADSPIYNHPKYSDYLSLYFIQFSLNKQRYVMHISETRETADKEGGISAVADVCVHSSLYLSCNNNLELCDKVSHI